MRSTCGQGGIRAVVVRSPCWRGGIRAVVVRSPCGRGGIRAVVMRSPCGRGGIRAAGMRSPCGPGGIRAVAMRSTCAPKGNTGGGHAFAVRAGWNTGGGHAFDVRPEGKYGRWSCVQRAPRRGNEPPAQGKRAKRSDTLGYPEAFPIRPKGAKATTGANNPPRTNASVTAHCSFGAHIERLYIIMQ